MGARPRTNLKRAPSPGEWADRARAELMATRPTLTLYTRAGCHLCEEMKRVLDAVARRVPFVVQEVDVATDPALEHCYGHEVPVLLLGGRKVAKYRISEARLVRLLAGAGDDA